MQIEDGKGRGLDGSPREDASLVVTSTSHFISLSPSPPLREDIIPILEMRWESCNSQRQMTHSVSSRTRVTIEVIYCLEGLNCSLSPLKIISSYTSNIGIHIPVKKVIKLQ